jgi:hypothetical protein
MCGYINDRDDRSYTVVLLLKRFPHHINQPDKSARPTRQRSRNFCLPRESHLR